MSMDITLCVATYQHHYVIVQAVINLCNFFCIENTIRFSVEFYNLPKTAINLKSSVVIHNIYKFIMKDIKSLLMTC